MAPSSPHPSPGEVRVGFKWHPGRFLAWVWGLWNRAPSQRSQAPMDPSWRTPLWTCLEACWGVCTQLKARAGSGQPNQWLPVTPGPSASLGSAWLPSAEPTSWGSHPGEGSNCRAGCQPHQPLPPNAMHFTKMPNSPPQVRAAKAPTSLPGTSFVRSVSSVSFTVCLFLTNLVLLITENVPSQPATSQVLYTLGP